MKRYTPCLNCRSVILKSDTYCHKCGQKNTEPVVPVQEFFKSFLEDYFTFDSKFFRSTVWLLTRPGYLTKEYIQGRRASYIPPVRVFLFVSVFFFLYEGCTDSGLNNDARTPEVAISDTTGSEKETIRVNGGLFDNFLGVCDKSSVQTDSARKAFFDREPEVFLAECHPNADRWSRVVYSKIFKLSRSNGNDFGGLLLNAASKVIFLLVPLFALLLKLLYLRRKRFYFEHFVFSLHFHTFLFLTLFVLSVLSDHVLDDSVGLIWTLYPFGILLYYVLSLHKVFEQSWLKTTVKAVLSLCLYMILFIPLGAILTLLYAFISY